jgi:hypothetical protein
MGDGLRHVLDAQRGVLQQAHAVAAALRVVQLPEDAGRIPHQAGCAIGGRAREAELPRKTLGPTCAKDGDCPRELP